jgi:hypothetical protein
VKSTHPTLLKKPLPCIVKKKGGSFTHDQWDMKEGMPTFE